MVEDDPLLRHSLARLLSPFFCSVSEAKDVDEALTVIEFASARQAKMIVVTDINLQTQNGNMLIRLIKQNFPGQKVIAISGSHDATMFVEAIRNGVDRFLLKPIDENDLFDALSAVVEQMEQAEELCVGRKLLEESREYALRLLEEQDLFLKNSIHEIYTPLSIMIANIDLLRLFGTSAEAVDAIEAASRMLQHSYEDMTYLMKRDRLVDMRDVVDIVAFVEERVRYFGCIATANAIRLSLHIDPSITGYCGVHIATMKLGRLIDNTISNAIKYSSRPGEVVLRIAIKRRRLMIEVHNRGEVIRDKTRIFERYYREADHKGGYGLGLNIVGQICKEENIRIHVTSSQRYGTTFRYILSYATLLQHSPDTMDQKTTSRIEGAGIIA